jgi:hypothetical protein
MKPYQKELSKSVSENQQDRGYQSVKAVIFRITDTRLTLSVDIEPLEDIVDGMLPVTM